MLYKKILADWELGQKDVRFEVMDNHYHVWADEDGEINVVENATVVHPADFGYEKWEIRNVLGSLLGSTCQVMLDLYALSYEEAEKEIKSWSFKELQENVLAGMLCLSHDSTGMDIWEA